MREYNAETADNNKWGATTNHQRNYCLNNNNNKTSATTSRRRFNVKMLNAITIAIAATKT